MSEAGAYATLFLFMIILTNMRISFVRERIKKLEDKNDPQEKV